MIMIKDDNLHLQCFDIKKTSLKRVQITGLPSEDLTKSIYLRNTNFFINTKSMVLYFIIISLNKNSQKIKIMTINANDIDFFLFMTILIFG